MNNNEKSCFKPVFYTITSTLIIMTLIYKFDLVYEQSLENNSKYIKKSEIELFINKQNRIILKKDSYILKSDFDKYIFEYLKNNHLSIIKKSELKNMKQSIYDLKKQNSEYSKLIINLKNNKLASEKKEKDLLIKKWSENLKKSKFQEEIKKDLSSPIYFIANSKKIDIQSLKRIEKIKKYKEKDEKKFYIYPCGNKLEKYNKEISLNRITFIKDILLKSNINPRKIIIKKSTLINLYCFDDQSEEIKDENNNLLVVGSIIEIK